jgi:hypothetical protein
MRTYIQQYYRKEGHPNWDILLFWRMQATHARYCTYSQKSKRVTRSTMDAETLAFVNAFDNSFILRHELSRMIGTNLPILKMTDSRPMFDVITRARYTT